MTVAKGTLRKRRSTTVENLPRALVEWFAGEPRAPDQSSVPWGALVYPDYVFLSERWLIWKAVHPAAHPPIGWEWLDDPSSPRHPADWLLDHAQKCARKK